ncbi:MAG: prepilin-type N-terminal cleavage/methylation domain-containing protein [Candidatus Omnitrophica bacterium]|nr:prepilin-type N-terminal cleavage/methylation domain-containing protein [Candidatus Omnitrophota bacterium]
MSSKGFTLTEVLIAIVLMGLVIVTVASVDITSRRFFGSITKESRIQDEAKIAMEHIVKNVQLGIGDAANPGLVVSADGTTIRVQQDTNSKVGKFDANDRTIEYRYEGGPGYTIVFVQDIINDPTNTENLAEGMVVRSDIFSVGSAPNQVDVEIQARRDPTQAKSLDNPETTLTSSIVLRAMSCK